MDASLILNALATAPTHHLFDLDEGVNEFECLWRNGSYYFYHHAHEAPPVFVRRASTLAELRDAPACAISEGLYPTVAVIDGLWHLWELRDARVCHLVATAWDGPYAPCRDRACEASLALRTYDACGDPRVRIAPNGSLVMAYRRRHPPFFAGRMTARSPCGPWTDQGLFFDARAPWHGHEEADPTIHFFADGGTALLFAAAAGQDRQSIAAAVLGPDFAPAGGARELVDPVEPWMAQGGSPKVFNPVIVETADEVALLFAHNPSRRGVPAGWGARLAHSRPGSN